MAGACANWRGHVIVCGLRGVGLQHDDLYTLETALLTRQLREDVRVVVQFGNPAVGRALTQVGVMVLDVAGLSAPSVVEACLRSGTQEISLSGERFTAARTKAPKAASLRELYRALAPVAGPGKPVPATARLSGHVLVIGLGSVGMRVVQQLAEACPMSRSRHQTDR